jgi:hypothetical protein
VSKWLAYDYAWQGGADQDLTLGSCDSGLQFLSSRCVVRLRNLERGCVCISVPFEPTGGQVVTSRAARSLTLALTHGLGQILDIGLVSQLQNVMGHHVRPERTQGTRHPV